MVSLYFLGVTGFKQWCLFIFGALPDLNCGVSLFWGVTRFKQLCLFVFGVLLDLNSGVSLFLGCN